MHSAAPVAEHRHSGVPARTNASCRASEVGREERCTAIESPPRPTCVEHRIRCMAEVSASPAVLECADPPAPPPHPWTAALRGGADGVGRGVASMRCSRRGSWIRACGLCRGHAETPVIDPKSCSSSSSSSSSSPPPALLLPFPRTAIPSCEYGRDETISSAPSSQSCQEPPGGGDCMRRRAPSIVVALTVSWELFLDEATVHGGKTEPTASPSRKDQR